MSTRQTIAVTLLFSALSPAWSQQSQTVSSAQKAPLTPDAKLSMRYYQRLATPRHENVSAYTIEGHLANTGNFFFDLDYGYDTSAQFITDNSTLAYSVASLYLGQSHSQTRWSLGRKVLPWNPTESYWGLSQLNGQEGFSPIAPKQEGLIGLHAEHSVGGLTGEIFASYFFLPRINPRHYEENGRLLSTNEWGAIPPRLMRLQDGTVPIRHTIDHPDTGEVIRNIVLKGSLGVSLVQRYRFGALQGSLRTYGLYKPENNLRYMTKNFYHSATQDYHVRSTLTPFVHYHTLGGIAVSHQIGDFSWDIHAAHNRTRMPQIDRSGALKLFFELHEIYYSSSNIANSFSYQKGPWNLGIHYLYASQTELYRMRINSMCKIPLWHRTWGLSLQYRNNTWSGLFDVKYDTLLYNTILKSEFSYRFPFGLTVGTRAEIIQSPQTRPYNYWSKYRTNDTLQTYLSYHF